VTRRLATLTALSALLVALPAATPGEAARHRIAPPPNPCIDPVKAADLLCPKISLSPPRDMYYDRTTHRGRVLLRATSSVNSVGKGPLEFRGRRHGPNTMVAVQRIYKKGGGAISIKTGARLGFKSIPGQYRYWKFLHPVRFELWSADRHWRPVERVRIGPKQYYCLRDLRRTHPRPRSPSSAHYPGCNQNRHAQRVTLGTSVGWSDIYPSTYFQQWIDVTGFHGRFLYRMVADPTGVIYTSSRRPVFSQRRVRIP
jgi:hypothetical protein